MKKKDSKAKKIILGIVAGVLVLFLLLLVLLIIFLYFVFTGGPATKTKDIEDYSIIFEKNVRSCLQVFPEEIPESATETTFDFYFRDTFNSPTVSIFLQADYSEEDYAAEVERLENIKKVYDGGEIQLLRDEEGTYPYPAYIAIENHHHTYEYALLSGDTQITYIYTAYFDRGRMRFDEEYLPSDFRYGAPEGENQFYYGFSYYVDEIDEEFGAIRYDYD